MENSSARRASLAAFSLTLCLAIVTAPPPVRAVTPEQLEEAIGSAALSFRDIVFKTWADSATTRMPLSDTSYDSSLAAGPGSVPGSLLLSTGRAADRGLGDSYLWRPNWRDGTSFEFTVSSPPPAARYLVFTVQFITSEIGSGRNYDDWAGGTTTVGACESDTVFASVSGALSSDSPRLTRIIDVQGLSTSNPKRVTFSIADARDGRGDSALLLSHVYFTDKSMLVPGVHESPCGDVVTWPEYNLSSGSCSFSRDLLGAPGRGLPFRFTIYYSSSQFQDADLGRKWRHSYDWTVKLSGKHAIVTRGDGGREYFTASADSFVAHPGNFNRLRHTGGGYEYATTTRVRYDFDSAGRLTAIRDGDGPTAPKIQLVHQGDGLYITDTRGNIATLQYDGAGRAYRLDYADQTIEFTYDGDNLDSYTVPGGLTTRFTYDDRSNLLSATNDDGVRFLENQYLDEKVALKRDGKGAETIFSYDENALRTRNRLGHERVDGFDALDRLVENVTPSGARWTFEYDSHHNVKKRLAPNLGVTEMEYDSRGNMTKKRDALGHTMEMTYGNSSNPSAVTSVRDEAGFTRSYEYDDRGSMVREIDPTSLSTDIVYTYTPEGQLQSVKDRNGNLSTFEYSSTGDRERIVQPASIGGEFRYTYDALGRVTSETDPNGHTTRYEYDAAGRLERTIDALEGQTAYTYDAEGRTLTETSPIGIVTHRTYTPTGSIETFSDPFGTTAFAYDAEDRLVTRTDPLGRTIHFEYDAADNLTGVIDAGGGHVTASYDAMGNRLSVTDARGNRTSFQYDILGRMIEERDPLGNVTSWTYDARGYLERTVNARGQSTTLRYDALGRLVELSAPEGRTLHTLDGNGNRVRTEGPGGVTSRSFNALNRMTERTDELGRTVGYTYDRLGNLIEIRYPDGKQVEYRYDELNRLYEVEDWNQNLTTYSYDAAGNLLTATLPDGSIVRYEYDRGRLRGIEDVANDSTICSSRFDLDAAGLARRITGRLPLEPTLAEGELSGIYDAANRLAAFGADSLEYDADGNVTRATLGGIPATLAHDATSQLLQVDADQYRYDTDGLRIRTGIGGAIVECVLDANVSPSQLLQEYDDQGNVVSYVYGLGLISREDSEGTLRIYHFDGRGNTLALTDAGGRITDRYAYDPFGRIVGRTGSTPNPFTYSGQFGVIDDGNGLYYARSRYYCPELMRFVQRDRLSRGSLASPGSLNAYAYASGNPLAFVDPEGDTPVQLIAAIVGACVGIAVQATLDAITLATGGDLGSGWEIAGRYAIAAGVGAVAGATGGMSLGWQFGLTMGAVALGNVAEQAIAQDAKDGWGGWFDPAEFGITMGVSGVTLGVLKGVQFHRFARAPLDLKAALRMNNASLWDDFRAPAEIAKRFLGQKASDIWKQGLITYAVKAPMGLGGSALKRAVLNAPSEPMIPDPIPPPPPVPSPHRPR